MPIRHLTPYQATLDLQRAGIDVREYTEFAAGHIAGVRLVPLQRLGTEAIMWDKKTPLLLVCRSGKRATQAAATLDRLGFTDLAILEGGMEAWRQMGLPDQKVLRQPWSLERQVRVIAGGMIVLSSLLAATVTPWFLIWTLCVGLGLTISGMTDLCLMAGLMGRLPWNRGSEKTGSKKTPCLSDRI